MWDQRYSADHYIYGTEPNAFLREFHERIPAGGKVLCLAEGEGRNAVFLAGHGYDVTAVDLSRVGLEKAERLAASMGVKIRVRHADLAEFELGEQAWDGIVSIFCHLPPNARQHVHQQIPRALKPGGVLLLEAYTPAQLELDTGGPPDESMMLTAGMLKNELPDLAFEHLLETEREVIEGSHHTGIGAVVQLIARRRQ